MDYALAIRRNRDQLRVIVLALFALAGLSSPLRNAGDRSLAQRGGEGGFPLYLPRSIIAAIMLVLRPAESALRRLIVIAAQGLKLSAPTKRPGGWPNLPPCGGDVRQDRGGYGATRAFKLFDPLKSFDPDSIWDAEPKWESGFNIPHTSPEESPAEPLPAIHLGQRLNSLLRAIDTIPHQARRLIRWQAKRDALLKARKPTRLSPMRPGLPPGWRERKVHEIDDVLKECHGLAHDRLSEPNTS